ncbi:MAG: hypothetical protein M3174_00545 [Actinomycetota bacterium]|nr:hypothetical protein [Actinomycetota bacterium]
MFVQVFHGKVNDREAMRKQFEMWAQNVKPGAIGYLGSTGGVTEDGEFVAAARFESEEAARRNSERPEQDEWWRETAQLFEGEPKFHDYTNVRLGKDGGSDDAGFVQVMHGKVNDVDKAQELSDRMDEFMPDLRPDVIGSVDAWKDNGGFTSFIYFTSEAEARENEKKEMPAEVQEQMNQWTEITEEIQFFDLKDPWFSSP